MSVQPRQRFLKSHPCPICGGWDDQARGKGERCWGFLSDDGKYAHCTRAELASSLPLEMGSQTYAHRLIGDCNCGTRHDPTPRRPRGRPRKDGDMLGRVVATYDYTDPDGKTLFQVTRHADPKDFRQRRPDGAGGWIGNIQGVWKVPYHVPELVASPEGATVYVCEGEKDVDNLRALGLLATCNAMGAKKWLPEYSAWLVGRNVVILPDNDDDGRAHALIVARSLTGAASVKVVPLPDLPPKGDVSDWLEAGGTREELAALVTGTPAWRDPDLPEPIAPRTLAEVHTIFRRWLYMPDTGALDVALATYAANRDDGNPIWLLLVAVPGSGKTEVLSALGKLPHVRSVGTLTVPSLLSGTSQRERAKSSKGGLLREIGAYGMLTLKDFGSLLSLHNETRQELLAALREIYDGSWSRNVGSDGGQVLEWTGKVGLIGGCTPAIDQHHSTMAALGERFILYRQPDLGNAALTQLADRALDLHGVETNMRAEISEAVTGLFTDLEGVPPKAIETRAERDYLITLARFATLARAPVVRETSSTRAIELIPGAEGPTRIVIVLAKLFAGLAFIGVERRRCWELLRKVALDSMPQLRRRALEYLADQEISSPTTAIAVALGHPTVTTRRTLEELEAYALVERQAQGEGRADLWRLSDWSATAWRRMATVPEITGDGDVITGVDTPATFSEITGDVLEKTRREKAARGNTNINNPPSAVVVISEKVPAIGNRVYPLNDTGARDTDRPVTIARIATGEDGQPWAEFVEIPGGWPLSKCDPA